MCWLKESESHERRSLSILIKVPSFDGRRYRQILSTKYEMLDDTETQKSEGNNQNDNFPIPSGQIVLTFALSLSIFIFTFCISEGFV